MRAERSDEAHRAARAAGRRLTAALAHRLAAIARVLHRLIGAPDYDAYLAHLRAHHPGTVPLSRTEFTEQRLRERYEKPGGRCC